MKLPGVTIIIFKENFKEMIYFKPLINCVSSVFIAELLLGITW